MSSPSYRSGTRYSESFKRKVVAEFEAGRWSSQLEAMRAYGIVGSGTIRHWLSRYGSPASDYRRQIIMNADEQSELEQLRRKNRDLEQALAQTQMTSLEYRALFNILCRETGIKDPETYKKNVAARSSTTSDVSP